MGADRSESLAHRDRVRERLDVDSSTDLAGLALGSASVGWRPRITVEDLEIDRSPDARMGNLAVATGRRRSEWIAVESEAERPVNVCQETPVEISQ